MEIKYEKIKEEFEEENEIIEQEIINLTAKTDKPLSEIIFTLNDKHLATTLTNDKGESNCGFSPRKEKVTVKAECEGESAIVEIPVL